MSDAAVKESRRVLRLVQEHLSQSHANLGVQKEKMGLVNVVHHPENTLPHLNYVSPRQKTAWVPGPEVEKGLVQLEELGRRPRVCYIEGLFPPLFAQSLRQLGLMVENELPIMTYQGQFVSEPMPDELHVERPQSQDGIALWWYVWRNARYDVYTTGTEPVYIGRDVREVIMGSQADLILYRYGFPVGVVRLTFNKGTANINALALMKEVRTPEMLKRLYSLALQVAAEKDCEIVFTAVKSGTERQICRTLGFIDAGNLVSYTRMPEEQDVESLFIS